MRRVDLLPASGLVVVRNALDKPLLGDFAAECLELRAKGANYMITSVPGEPAEVATTGLFAHNVSGYPATQRVVSMLFSEVPPIAKLALNTQAPGAAQNFHRDSK